MGITFAIFFEEPLLRNFSSLLCWTPCLLFFLLHLMEKGKGDNESGGTSGQAFAMRECGWCATLVVVMNLL